MSPRRAPCVPWRHRLSVRLTVLLVLAHLFFLFLLPRVYELGMSLFAPAAEVAEVAETPSQAAASGPPTAEQAALERVERRRKIVASSAALSLVVVIGLLVSSAVSRLVTRRVTRIAEQVAVPFLDQADLPGPFDVTGNDEIALLVRTMNATRSKVEALILTLAEREAAHRAWVGQISHELRTPLTALMACLDRTQMELQTLAGDELVRRMHALVESMRADAKRVNLLVDDLLDIVRLDMQGTLISEPVPPGELARQVVALLATTAAANDIRLATLSEPGLPIPSADGRRLMRALENLVRNAIQHAKSQVEIHIEAVPAAVRFEVLDDGQGFAGQPPGPIDLDLLAGRRARGDSAGLGLIVARKVVEAHAGSIGARNRAGGGGSTWFEIPL